MNANVRCILVAGMVVAFLVGGCASTSAPDDWQSSARAMQREAYGAWIDVTVSPYADSAHAAVQGELIAVHADSFLVLPLDGALQAVDRASVRTVALTTFDANWGYLSTWTALGTLSTLSHGVVLILSAPVWMLGGSAAAAAQSYRPMINDPGPEILRRYARFPQGLPPGVAREALTSKPAR